MSTEIEKKLQNEHPNANICVVDESDTGPYKVYSIVIRTKMFAHNPDYPEDNRCLCGHTYYRHFDPYENWDAVGCKYCQCGHFVHEDGAARVSPFERMQRFGQWRVELEDYLLQWDMFGYLFYPTLAAYLGSTVKQWQKIIAPYTSPEANGTFFCDEEFVEVLE